MVLYIRQSAVEAIPAPSEHDELASLADVDPEAEFSADRRLECPTNEIDVTVNKLIDESWARIKSRDNLKTIKLNVIRPDAPTVEAFATVDKFVFVATKEQLTAVNIETDETFGTFDSDDTIIWIKCVKLNDFYQVFVADDLGTCMWLLFSENVGFTEVKQLNQGGEGIKAKVITIDASDCGSVIACSMMSSTESWIQLYRLNPNTIASWSKEMSNESTESESSSSKANLSGNPESFRLKTTKLELSIRKHDLYSIMNMKQPPVDVLHEENYIYNEQMATAFDLMARNEAARRRYLVDESWMKLPLKRSSSQVVRLSQKLHLIVVSCETSDRILFYLLGQKLNLMQSIQVENHVVSFHLTEHYLAMATKTTVSVFKISPEKVTLMVVLPTVVQVETVVMIDGESPSLVMLDKNNGLYIFENLDWCPFQQAELICNHITNFERFNDGFVATDKDGRVLERRQSLTCCRLSEQRTICELSSSKLGVFVLSDGQLFLTSE